MREWIKDLKPGENSFQHSKIKPYKIINGEKIKLKSEHLGNKFKRLDINKPAACINTRSDQLASQETIHPFDDGNGRIARAIADMFLARSEQSPQRYYLHQCQCCSDRQSNPQRSADYLCPRSQPWTLCNGAIWARNVVMGWSLHRP
jgi:hypothetical protein